VATGDDNRDEQSLNWWRMPVHEPHDLRSNDAGPLLRGVGHLPVHLSSRRSRWPSGAGLLTLAFLAVAAVTALAQEGEPTPGPDFTVVVNVQNPTGQIDRDLLGKIFLKKVKRWDDGESVTPVDQLEDSQVRDVFTEEVHGKKVTAIKAFWQRMIFSGRDVPPRELPSDEAVLAFVRGERGGVGYVSADADLGEGVKALRISE
jgi:hypothetical protein